MLMQAKTQDIAKQTSENLRERFQRLLAVTVEAVSEMASIVRELEGRGEDLSDLRGALLFHLRKIAYGQLDARVYVELNAYPSLLRKVELLPLVDQLSIVDGDEVDVAILRNGTADSWKCKATNLTPELIKQVFGERGIRTIEEQIAFLRSRDGMGRNETDRVHVRIDRRRKGIWVGPSFVAVRDLERYVEQLS